MTKYLVLFIAAFSLGTATSFAQCSFTPAISSPSGTNVCAGSVTLTALPLSDTCVQKTSFPASTRFEPVGFSVGNKGYMGLGLNKDDLWEYDPSTNAWTQKANFPIAFPIDYYRAFTIGTKAYVAAVSGTAEIFYEYNPAINTWTVKASPGVGRLEPFAFSTPTKGYIGGGSDVFGSTVYNDLWEYDPVTNSWTQKANFGGGQRRNAFAFGLGTLGYVGSGFDQSTNSMSDFWEYNPAANLWTQKANYPWNFAGGNTAFTINNSKAYVLEPLVTFGTNIWEYNPLANAWTAKPKLTMATPMFDAVAFSIGSRGYFGGGNSSQDFFEYNFTYAYSWSTGPTTGAISASTSATYSVTMTDVLGCTATGSRAMIINPYPVVVFSQADVCAGRSITLTASGATSYTWSANAGGVTTASAAISPAASTSYTVNATGPGPCTVSVIKPVFVTTAPSASVLGLANFCGPSITMTASPPGNSWTQKTSCGGGGRNRAIGLSIGNKGYIGMGFNSSFMPQSDFWEYDPATDAWTQKASFTGGTVFSQLAFSIGDKGYLYTGNPTNNFWEYNQATNTWMQKTSFPLLITDGVGLSIGNRGYIGTGNTGGSALTDSFWEYDPYNNTWLQKASVPGGARTEGFGLTIGSKGYVGGGRSSTFSTLFDVWEYTPASNSWIQKANLPPTYFYSSMKGFSIANKGYINPGQLGGSYEFDAVANTWASGTPFSGTSRNFSTAFGIGGKGYFSTGSQFSTYYDDLWEFDPVRTFLWSNGSTTVSSTATVSGTYSVLITSAIGCTVSAAKTLTINPEPSLTVTVSVPFVCSGGTTALTAGGAFTYTWSDGISNGAAFSPTLSATYTVIGTAVTGCTASTQRNITVNTTPTVTANTSSSIVCSGKTLTLNGGGASTYTWTGGVSNGVAFAPTITGSYTVTGATASGCSNTAAVTVTVNTTPTVTASTSQSVICRNRSVTLTGGGTASSYTWTGGVTDGAAFSPTSTATYTVTGASPASCTNTAVMTITVNPLPVVTASVTNPVICNGATTALQGGGANTYTWSGGITNAAPFSPGTTTTYTVTGTDANTCTNTASSQVIVNPLSPVTANASHTFICAGTSVTLSGGGATSYAWSGGITNGLPFAPATTLDYTVTGTDAVTGCTNTAARTITVNSIPVVTANASQSVICMNASVTLNGGGASTYTWTGGVGNGIAFSPTITATYTVTGRSASNCTNIAVKSITVNALPVVTASVSNPVICFSATTSLSGGGASSYAWTGGVTNGIVFSPGTSATYTVTGTDANSCTNTAVTNITVHALPLVTANTSNSVICAGGTVALNGGGATTYTWANAIINGAVFQPGATSGYTVTGTNAVTSCTNSAVITITVNSLPIVSANVTDPVICMGDLSTLNGGGASTYIWTGGAINGTAFSPTLTQSYTVTGTDVNSCTNTAVTSITVNNLPNVTAGISNSVICYGDIVVVTGSGANTYTWTGSVIDGAPFSPTLTSSYTVTGTDLNACFNTAAISVTVNSLPAVTASTSNSVVCSGNTITLTGGGATSYTWTSGVVNAAPFTPLITETYTITGTDANGCDNSASITVTVNALPVVTASASNPVICLNATTSLNGGGAVSYTWSGGVTNGAIFSPAITDTYSVTGTDANGCKESATQLIVVNSLPAVTGNVSAAVICKNDPVFFTGGGASIYLWTGGVIDGLPFSPMVTDTYTVTGIDINTCTNTAVVSVTVNSLPTVTSSASPSVICFGDLTTLTGGGAVSYTWSGTVTDGIPFSPNTTDTYTVTGTGVNGCTNTAVRSVTVNPLPLVTANTSHSVICLNYTTSLNGGGAMTYTWSGIIVDGVAFSPTITDTYTVTGTDAKGCKNTAMQTITVNALPVVTGTASSPVICDGEFTTLNGSGATTYAWSGGVSDGLPFSPTVTITYTVTGTDLNACSNTTVVTVVVNNTPTITTTASPSVICFGDLTTLSGGGAVSYTWSGTVTDGTPFSPSATDSYIVTGTSVDGCTNTAVTSVTVNNLPSVIASVNTPTVCDGGSVIFNGGGAFTYTWTNGIIDGSAFTPTATETYSVAGTDLNGCINENTVAVTVYSLPVISGSTTHSVICSGESVTLSGAGATSYTWSNGVSDGIAFSPALTETYTLTGSTNGCSNSTSVMITVTVNALPVITVNSGSICAGESFTIIPAGAANYTYSGGQVVSPSGTTTYSITGLSPEGCVNNPPALSSVFVHALPAVNLSSPQTTLCAGNSTTLQASGASTYIWNTGGSGAEIAVAPNTPTVYSVSGTDINTCTSTNTILITVIPLPSVTIAADRTSICRGTEISLTTGGADTYSWSTGDLTSSFTAAPLTSIIYSVTGTNGAFCHATRTISILVNPIPVLDAGPDLELQAGEPYSFNATQLGAVIFKWESHEGLSDPDILNPAVTVDHDITYTLTVTSNKGCSAKDEVSIRISDGLTVANYMSPNNDGKNDTWKISNLHLIKNYKVEIVDGWGKTVFHKENSYTNEFDAADLPEGVYYYFITDGGKVKYKGSITLTR